MIVEKCWQGACSLFLWAPAIGNVDSLLDVLLYVAEALWLCFTLKVIWHI